MKIPTTKFKKTNSNICYSSLRESLYPEETSATRSMLRFTVPDFKLFCVNIVSQISMVTMLQKSKSVGCNRELKYHSTKLQSPEVSF